CACADDGDVIEGHGFSGEQFRGVSSPRGAPRDASVAGTPLRGPITTDSGIWVPTCVGTTGERYSSAILDCVTLPASIAGASPLGGGGAVTSWSDQRACGAAASVSVSPSARRSAPAQAIMAPLSVHSAAGGATSTVPVSNATWCRTLRIARLAATPPAATSAFGLP